MPVSKVEVITKTFRVNYHCDDCGNVVQSIQNNFTLLTYPAKYGHICTHCKKEYLLPSVYPKLVTEIVENQCDGCGQGLDLDEEGLHRTKDGKVFMACVRECYTL